MKNVLIISASMRLGSNSDALAREFARGAEEAGNKVEYISLRGKKLSFCTGCLTCQETLKCAIADDAPETTEKVRLADAVLFATPVYYYSVSGQLKTLFDRMNPLFPSDYKFRDVYLAATATEDEPSAFEGPQKAVQGWIDCFENARLAGTVFGGGVTEPHEAEKNAALLARARALGRNV